MPVKGSLLTFDGYHIPTSSLKPEQITKIKKDLTVIPTDSGYGAGDEEKTKYKIYKDEPKKINNKIVDVLTIPRYYGIENYGQPESTEFKETKVSIQFTGTLRDYQKVIVANCLAHINKNGGGLLAVPCGTGKTSIAIYIASQLGLKTLVLTHKSFLQDQWVDRIHQFTKAKVGIIRQKQVDVENKDIVIGMIQSISKRNYDLNIFKDFGLVVIDECFAGSEYVMTNSGKITIESLYELWVDQKPLPLIQSYNEQSKKFEYKQMTYAWEKEVTGIVRIQINNETIVCTPNHLFLTSEGYVEAKDLKGKLLCGYTNDFNDSSSSDNCRMSNHIVTNVIKLEETIKVYDIEVEDNHNFLIVSNDVSSIVHNCHRFGSKHFSKALYKVGAKYTIALTATPKRADGLMKVVNWFMGNIMYQIKLKVNKQVVSKIITFLSDDKLFTEIIKPRATKKFGRWITANKPDFVQMLSNIIEIKERNDMIVTILNTIRKDPERKILVLSERIAHLKTLKEGLDKKIQESVDSGEILKDECKTYFYIGDLKRTQREEAEDDADILFGSYKMAEEGLDIDRLNTIVLATPKKDVIQSVGRILRKVLKNGDTRPLVIDIADKLSIFSNQGLKREEYYTKSKYVQHFYYTHNGKLISPMKYLNLTRNPNPNASHETPNSFDEILEVPPVEILEEDNNASTFELPKATQIEHSVQSESLGSSESEDEKPKKFHKKNKTKKTKSDSESEDEKPKKINKTKKAKAKTNDDDDCNVNDFF